MLNLFIVIVFFLCFLLLGIALQYIAGRSSNSFFRTVYSVAFFVGVVFHEISHFLMCFILRVPVERINIRFYSDNRVNPHGYVSLRDLDALSFGKASLIAFAPLFFTSYLFLTLLFFLSTLILPLWAFVLLGVISFSLVVGSVPSTEDLKVVTRSLVRNPFLSLYEIILFFSCFLVCLVLEVNFGVFFNIDLFFYISVFACYIVLNFVFKGIARLIKRDGILRA